MSTESNTEATAEAGIKPDRETRVGEARQQKKIDQLLVEADSDVSPELTIVMPTLNEEEGIRECISKAKTAIQELEIVTEIIVSDSSSDDTPDIAREMGAIVVEPRQSGYGNAYKYAFSNARGTYIAMADADTTYDFEELPKLVAKAKREQAAIVLGSRLEGEIKSGAMPMLHQHIGNPLLTKFLNVFYDAGVSDAHSGFRVIRRGALEQLDLNTGGMEFASEMIMDAAAKDMPIEEVSITYHRRRGEATLDSFRDGWRHVKFMLVNAPGYLFSLPAAVFMLLGIVTMGLSVLNTSVAGLMFGVQTMIGGTLLTISGYQIGSLGLFSSIAGNPIRDPQDALTQVIRQNFRLEHGASLGVGMCGIGLLFMGYSVTMWSIQGISAVPAATWNLLAATIVVLGIQTVFSSFFFTLLSEGMSVE